MPGGWYSCKLVGNAVWRAGGLRVGSCRIARVSSVPGASGEQVSAVPGIVRRGAPAQQPVQRRPRHCLVLGGAPVRGHARHPGAGANDPPRSWRLFVGVYVFLLPQFGPDGRAACGG